jgi:hypothetical protein
MGAIACQRYAQTGSMTVGYSVESICIDRADRDDLRPSTPRAPAQESIDRYLYGLGAWVLSHRVETR